MSDWKCVVSCPTCNNEMILTKATNFGAEYYYCRTCKKELSEMPAKKVEPPAFKQSCSHVFDTDLVCQRCGHHWYSMTVQDSLDPLIWYKNPVQPMTPCNHQMIKYHQIDAHFCSLCGYEVTGIQWDSIVRELKK